MQIVVAAPEAMNLLGLLIAGLLRRALAADRPRAARRLRGDVLLDASGMRVTLRFGDDRVEITRQPPRRAVASIQGTLAALVDVALGRGLLRAWLGGRLRARGRPLALLRLLRVLREGRA